VLDDNMALAIGVWSLRLTPGKEEVLEPPADIRITNVALGDVLKDASGRTTVKLTFEMPGQAKSDEEEEEDSPPQVTTVLCSLKPDILEQTTTDLILQEEETYKFSITGKNTVYLTGNYIEQAVNNPPYDDKDLSDTDEEDAYDLREVSSDVEMHPDDLESDGSRFEEVAEEGSKGQKRPRESDADENLNPSKSEKKKKKKQKVGSTEVTEGAKAEPKKAKSPEVAKSQGEEREITGGIKVLDAKVGTGASAKKGNTVRMRYIGKLENGKVFDKNVKGKPFTFHLGKGEVIKGWDEGIVGMKVGGERKLIIPSAMGYGKAGTDGIPPNSTLIFEVKLIELK